MNWDEIGFVICKPDAVYLHLEAEICKFLQGKGFQILFYKYVRINRDLCRGLYPDRYAQMKEHWELEAEFYELGDSLCLIIKGEIPREYESVSSYINDRWKGSFIPEEAREDTIRGKFAALTPVFDLIHAADCTEAAKREIRLFFTEKETNCLQELRYVNLRQKHPGELDSAYCYFRLKLQLIQAATMDPHLKRAYFYYVQEQHKKCKQVNRNMTRRLLYRMLQEENELFSPILKANPFLAAITSYRHFTKINYDKLFQQPLIA
ncbi:MAG: nucleoside-diphosphate kinase, partial [Ectobacillus sp.]